MRQEQTETIKKLEEEFEAVISRDQRSLTEQQELMDELSCRRPGGTGGQGSEAAGYTDSVSPAEVQAGSAL